jgi:hypothetical protein
MRLTELTPRFLKLSDRGWLTVENIGDAQGIVFLCPKCFVENGGPIGTQSVICWSRSRGVPDDVRPNPGRWALHGTGFDDLSLDADPPSSARSVLLSGGCAWHGFVTGGEVT